MLEPYLKKTRDANVRSTEKAGMRVAVAGKVSLSNLGGTSRPRRSSWGENLRYTSRFPNVSQIFQKSDFLKKISQNLDPKMEVTPKSRSTWHDAEVPTLAGPGPYLARANSRAQCRGQRLSARLEILQTLPNLERRAQSTHMFAVL